MGIDHTRLVYRYAGRDFRLSDVDGKRDPPGAELTLRIPRSDGAVATFPSRRRYATMDVGNPKAVPWASHAYPGR